MAKVTKEQLEAENHRLRVGLEACRQYIVRREHVQESRWWHFEVPFFLITKIIDPLLGMITL